MASLLGRIRKIKARLGKWFWVALVVLLFVVWRIVAGSTKSIKVQSVKVSRGDLVQTVSTSGTVKADQYSPLTFPTGGKVAAVSVKAGDKVKKGQFIASLDLLPLSVAYQQALNNYRNYQAAAEYAVDQVKDHSSDETFAQKASRTAAEVARDNAYDSVRAAQDNLQNGSIFAPFAGIIDTAVPSSPGINVTPAGANYTLVNPDTVYFDAEVEETDLPNLIVGQKVNIKLDAYPNDNFEGSLSNIGLVAFTSSTGGNAYHVRISLPKNDNLKFRVGMQGDADIIFGTVPQVLKVSTSSLVNDAGKSFVWVIDGGKIKKVEVTTGVESNDETEIKSGISEGQSVVDNPPANLKVGTRVNF